MNIGNILPAYLSLKLFFLRLIIIIIIQMNLQITVSYSFTYLTFRSWQLRPLKQSRHALNSLYWIMYCYLLTIKRFMIIPCTKRTNKLSNYKVSSDIKCLFLPVILTMHKDTTPIYRAFVNLLKSLVFCLK